MTVKDLNLQFFGALNQIFKLKKHRTWNELSKEITIDKIKATYECFGKIFHSKLDRYELLPKYNPTESLTSIFHGTLDGQTIINNISRYSLYSDQIIVFHPLQNPNITHPDYNPILHPEQWRYEFVNALYFYIVLQKWVQADLVQLVENPFLFDADARDVMTKEAGKRVDELKDKLFVPELMDQHEEMMLEKFKTSFLGMPLEVIKNTISKSKPNLTQQQVDRLAQDLKQYEKTRPLYVDFGESKGGNLMVNRAGGNIEMIDALCNLTGAHSYSTQSFIKKQLELRGSNQFWTKFSSLYSGLNFTYLDKVDTSFALEIRKEDRISGLRQSLRNLSSFLETADMDNIPEDKILSFNDEFKQQVKESEEEWINIINDAQKRKATAFFGSSVIGAVIDPTKIIVPAIGLPSSIAIIEFFKNRGLKIYRQKDPFSVYVDLKNKKPDFFSDLKNCIF
jgi:hypothetical protein